MKKKPSPRLPISASPRLPTAPLLSAEQKQTTPQRNPRRVLTESVPDPELLQQHEREREDAFYAVHQWNGKELLPMTRGRASQFWKLRLADDAPRISACLAAFEGSGGKDMSFLGDAIRILYLCSHEPRAWALMRESSIIFLEQIEQWAEIHIKPGDEKTAIRIALQIFNNSKVQEAEPAPSDRKGSDLGE